MSRIRSYALGAAAGAVFIAAGYLVTDPTGPGRSESTAACTAPRTPISAAVSSEKADLIAEIAAAYNATGRCAQVHIFTGSAGSTVNALDETWDPHDHGGEPMPTVLMPSASTWLNMATTTKNQPINLDRGRAPSVVQSPLVIAVPKRVKDKLQGNKLGWADILRLGADRDGWARLGDAGWGTFKLGKTNPNSSTSAMHAMIAMYSTSAASYQLGLTEQAVSDGRVDRDLASVERAVVHYGDTTLTFLERLALQPDPLSYVSAIAVEEKSVYDFNRGYPDGKLEGDKVLPKEPLAAIYPTEGTLVSDNPYLIMEQTTLGASARAPRDTSSDERAAAGDFLRYLQDPAQQNKLRRGGFRGADGKLADTLPGDSGLEPIAIKELGRPSHPVLAKMYENWAKIRKPGRIILAMDVSGSMKAKDGEQTRMERAKAAAIGALDCFGTQDYVGLWTFSGPKSGGAAHTEAAPVGPLNVGGLGNVIRGLNFNPKNDTALYATIADAAKQLADTAGPDVITAVIVLSDGQNDWRDNTDLEALVRTVGAANKPYPVRIYTIGYGPEADIASLARIAEASGGQAYKATDAAKLNQIMQDVINEF